MYKRALSLLLVFFCSCSPLYPAAIPKHLENLVFAKVSASNFASAKQLMFKNMSDAADAKAEDADAGKNQIFKMFGYNSVAPTKTELPSPHTAPTPAPAPEKPTLPLPPPTTPFSPSALQEPVISYESAFIKMLLTLAGLILAVFLTIWILRRLGQGRFRGVGSQRAIQILEKRPLSPKSILYLVQIGSKQVLIAESQIEVRRLTTLEDTLENEEK